LATRCPACGTVFRVVRDQLKVSAGWVRCGRCSEVFNAGQRLFDLEHEGAAGTQAVDAAAAPPSHATKSAEPMPGADNTLRPAAARVRSALAPPSQPAALWEPERRAATAPQPPGQAVAEPAQGVRDRPPAATADAVATDTPEDASLGPAADAAAAPAVEAAAESTAEPAHATAHAPTPEFIRRADRAARWRHPARRGALAALSLLLGALLAAQIALYYRDRLAASWPVSQPWLQSACNMLDCRIEAPRHIDSLSVDSSGLVRVEGSSMYRLSLVLQNKASTRVHMPAVELALTDTQGQTMARRVLHAAELGNPAESLAPRAEVLLQATLELGEQRVAGYTLELFYP
jgi:predicted Zn finger-like uncharacterized protein